MLKRFHMRRDNGNILFLILLAVVLFAALSYAVTSSMRGGGNDATKETHKSAAASVVQYMTMVRAEVQRLMLVNDCKVENLDFRNDVYKRVSNAAVDSSATPSAPKAGCAVFTSQGGAISPITFEKYAADDYMAYYQAHDTNAFRPGHFGFRWVNRLNEGTALNDVAMFTLGLKNEICANMLNPNNPPATLPVDMITNSQYGDYPPPFSTAAALIDHPDNLYGDIFALPWTNAGGTYCLVGMILVPR